MNRAQLTVGTLITNTGENVKIAMENEKNASLNAILITYTGEHVEL